MDHNIYAEYGIPQTFVDSLLGVLKASGGLFEIHHEVRKSRTLSFAVVKDGDEESVHASDEGERFRDGFEIRTSLFGMEYEFRTNTGNPTLRGVVLKALSYEVSAPVEPDPRLYYAKGLLTAMVDQFDEIWP